MKSENEGDLRRANWDDLNYPARFAPLVAAGLPVLLYDNSGALVAAQTLARQFDIGIFFKSMATTSRTARRRCPPPTTQRQCLDSA